MTVNRETFIAAGRAAAQRGDSNEWAQNYQPKTWQRKAWLDGFNSYMKEVQEHPPIREHGKSDMHTVAILQQAMQHRDRWPPSVREHVLNLLKDIEREKNSRRKWRLVQAVLRLADRHDPRKRPQIDPQTTGGR